MKVEAVHLALGANVLPTQRAIPAASAGDERVHRYPIAYPKVSNTGSEFSNLPTEFVLLARLAARVPGAPYKQGPSSPYASPRSRRAPATSALSLPRVTSRGTC